MKLQINFLKIDLLIQSILLIINTSLWLTFYTGYSMILAFYLLFFIGVYQFLLSAPINLLKNQFSPDLNRFRKIHFFGSVIYLSLLFLLSYLNLADNWLYFSMLFVIPEFIAYAYFALTWKDYQARRDYWQNRPTIFA